MSAEARIHPRFSLTVVADVVGDEIMLARPVADVSLGGCRFGGEAWENPGTEVQLVLSFPTIDAHLPVMGVVVRASDRDMGVRFQDLSDEQKWALRKYMREAQREATA